MQRLMPFQILVFLWLVALAPGCWAQGVKVGANTRCEVHQTALGLRITYKIDFDSLASRRQWEILDENNDGILGSKEVVRYINRRASWFHRPVLIRSMELGAPSRYSVDGDAHKLSVFLSWDLPSQASHWTVRWTGTEQLVGKHEMVLHLPTTPPSNPEFQRGNLNFSRVAGPARPWVQRWSWDNSASEWLQALTSKSAWVGLLMAFGLGVLHAVTLRQGRKFAASYLSESRRTLLHAVVLGLTVTMAHTLVIFMVGVATIWLVQRYLPPSSFPWVGVVCGTLITAIGLKLLSRKRPSFLDFSDPEQALVKQEVYGGHPNASAAERGLLAFACHRGLAPCSEALVALFSAIAFSRLVMGLLVLGAFTAGLAVTLTATAVMVVRAAPLLERKAPSSGSLARFSDIAHVFVVLMGLLLAARSLLQTGAFSML